MGSGRWRASKPLRSVSLSLKPAGHRRAVPPMLFVVSNLWPRNSRPSAARLKSRSAFDTNSCLAPHSCSYAGQPKTRLPAIHHRHLSKRFPGATKRRAHTACASRLIRRGDVRAARAWYYATYEGDVPRGESMPDTASGILQRVRELGSWRVVPLG